MQLKTGIRAVSIKLRGESGETLAETLVSILISSLAMLMLAAAIGSAVNIIKNSRDKMEDFYGDESSMIASTSSSSLDNLDLTLGVALKDKDGEASLTKNVKVYKSTDDSSGIAMYRSEKGATS